VDKYVDTVDYFPELLGNSEGIV